MAMMLQPTARSILLDGPIGVSQIVYDDHHLRVVFFPSKSNTLLVNFSNMLFKMDGDTFWARNLCRKSEISGLGFVAKRPNWFPAISMHKAEDHLRSLLASYETRLCYGNSMGAYAALKYSRLLNATAVAAFCPQYSISPSVVEAFDHRFTPHHDQKIHDGMEIKAADISGHVYLFYDQFEKPDVKHVELIHGVCPQANLLNVAMTGHHSIGAFANTAAATDMISACLKQDIQSLKRRILIGRRLHPMRPRHVAQVAIDRHQSWSLAILEKYADVLPREEVVRCYIHLAAVLRAKNEFVAAGDFARKCVDAARTMPADQRKALRLNHVMHAAAALLSRAGHFEEAIQAENEAIDSDPTNLSYLRRLLEISLASGDDAWTISAAKRLFAQTEVGLDVLLNRLRAGRNARPALVAQLEALQAESDCKVATEIQVV
ncbi:tetratricopeptide repeat protein [Roseomonas aerophila]|uniref:Tetratricopeptide repeat protein n=1 Tax=Teichococcus aerophilus TaxID=1224513 RepID=A0ABR7RPY1_9PROT|nr:tetratricopeptide repeat protein [Pseudoroseomonas aerophila]MBC9208210.1 tetratricopeptide repeat protein [Pseudoroseomonas aerophila]